MHARRAAWVNEQLRPQLGAAFMGHEPFDSATYRRYYNHDGFHFVRVYHELVARYLKECIDSIVNHNKRDGVEATHAPVSV